MKTRKQTACEDQNRTHGLAGSPISFYLCHLIQIFYLYHDTHVQSFMDYCVKQFANNAGAATDCLYLRTSEVMSGLTIATRKGFFSFDDF